MKLFSGFLIVVLLAFVSVPFVLERAYGQETSPPSGAAFTYNAKKVTLDGDGLLFMFTCATDTNTSDTSYAFTPDGYIGEALTTYPVSYGLKHSSTAGVSAMKMFIEGSYGNGYWVRTDTLLGTSAVDSTETFQSGTLDNNNKKFPYWRVIGAGQNGNRSDNTWLANIYFYRKDTK